MAAAEAGQQGLSPPGRQGKEAQTGTGSPGLPLESTPQWRFGQEPYLPRPIISVHVRQGDKVQEMELFGFQAYMALAYRSKRLVPGVNNIWLSTEQQSRRPAQPQGLALLLHKGHSSGTRMVQQQQQLHEDERL